MKNIDMTSEYVEMTNKYLKAVGNLLTWQKRSLNLTKIIIKIIESIPDAKDLITKDDIDLIFKGGDK